MINRTKSGILHFRPNNLEATQHIFQCGYGNISIMNSYKYLGLQLTDRLDLTHTAKVVSQSANRALGLLISKVKAMGGVSYNCYIKLFDSLVWPVINYGAAIWGTRSYPCIDAVCNRACRFLIGVCQQAPVATIQGDMCITPALIRQYCEILRQYSSPQLMPHSRVSYKVYM